MAEIARIQAVKYDDHEEMSISGTGIHILMLWVKMGLNLSRDLEISRDTLANILKEIPEFLEDAILKNQTTINLSDAYEAMKQAQKDEQ